MESGIDRQNLTWFWKSNGDASNWLDCHTLRSSSATLVYYDYYGCLFIQSELSICRLVDDAVASAVRFLIQEGSEAVTVQMI